MSVLNIFSSTLIQKSISFGEHRNACDVPPAFQVKQSAKVMVWGDMTGRGLTKLHMLPTSQTLTSEYYINQILEKKVTPMTSRRQLTGGPIERKLFSSKKEMTFVQDGAPAHTSKATQTWCQKNLQTL